MGDFHGSVTRQAVRRAGSAPPRPPWWLRMIWQQALEQLQIADATRLAIPRASESRSCCRQSVDSAFPWCCERGGGLAVEPSACVRVVLSLPLPLPLHPHGRWPWPRLSASASVDRCGSLDAGASCPRMMSSPGPTPRPLRHPPLCNPRNFPGPDDQANRSGC